MLTYKETLKYLYGLTVFGIKPGLKRISALLNVLGDPHRRYPCVHIAGTNGKGSTAAALESILTEADYKTGLYTSPHLVRFNERIRISKELISDRDVIRAASDVKKAAEEIKGARGHPTFFEFATAMAFQYFMEKGVDIAVIEAGMGGRLDATNVITPLVSIITNIGLDHTDHLGSDLSEIAREKAGIIKKGVTVITAEDKRGPLGVIRRVSKEKGSALFRLGEDFSYKEKTPECGVFDYSGIGGSFKGLKVNLPGRHQYKNCSCALAAAEALTVLGFSIQEKVLRRGLKKIFWPGRLEVVKKKPLIILDCAHNPHGARALKEALEDFRYRKLFVIIGIMNDKDIEGIFRELVPLADTVILTMPKTPRAATAGLLKERLKPFHKETFEKSTVADACKEAVRLASPNDAVLVTGSIFTVGEAKEYLSRAILPKRPSWKLAGKGF